MIKYVYNKKLVLPFRNSVLVQKRLSSLTNSGKRIKSQRIRQVTRNSTSNFIIRNDLFAAFKLTKIQPK